MSYIAPYIITIKRDIRCLYSNEHFEVAVDYPLEIAPEDIDLEAKDMFENAIEDQMETDGWVDGIHPDVFYANRDEIREWMQADDQPLD